MSNLKNIILKYVEIIRIKMNTKECLEYKSNNYDKYFHTLKDYVPEFSEQYPTLFKLLIKDDVDLSILDLYLDKIESINNGEDTLENVRNNLGHFLHNKYVKK